MSSFSFRESRSVLIPGQLVSIFAKLALANTNTLPRGIETCAILGGMIKGHQLIITTLLVPKQTGKADTCVMTHEEELFDYCITHDLLTLGWIHTHPSQNCFLSSMDMHTQCGFQAMLPEAIAIVYAPTDRTHEIGVFRLTDPEGLTLIQKCTLKGFHPHPTNVKIYGEALTCTWHPELSCTVVDLRL